MNRRIPRTVATAVATALALTAAAPAATAADGQHRGGHHARTRQAMDAAVADGIPGALAQVRDRHGTWTASSGVADVETERPRVRPDRFRIGSVTKPFVAVVALQLQQEGRLDLDDPVERWLPGVVRGGGHDGREITVRQLLNHTSGIHDYVLDPEIAEKAFGKGFFEHRYDTYTPEELVGVAMRHEPFFPPGTGWRYSNTNYVLAGMIVEAVTGNPYAEEIERRVLRPLGLRSTVLPGTRATMPRPHGRGYAPLDTGGGTELVDVTDVNPSIAGAAGEMVSTVDDLHRFLRALLDGRLLTEESTAEMFATVPTEPGNPARYGLGIRTHELSCGVTVWGHGGSIHGSLSGVFATRDGGHAAVFNLNGNGGSTAPLLEAEFCGRAPEAPGAARATPDVPW
ncbi:MAG TPA: serine hydrolase domain-containing protein [Streptomyces sp.]|uniref:serine hydrolase domain-containing protein n=1 Tax=Streptomyces sp. TaxID=1931 RepID=UPI002D6DB1FF|nr:serine hydrolase domain-containing protein [Streptomyces sp.]HZG07006.1 serine hydrolase domain-containing protein [Streptomyces sp.]